MERVSDTQLSNIGTSNTCIGFYKVHYIGNIYWSVLWNLFECSDWLLMSMDRIKFNIAIIVAFHLLLQYIV
jgi:hypothetical protein